LSQLRQQLEEAVRDEDYELAAKLRDKMKQLESAPDVTNDIGEPKRKEEGEK
jgi:protein-arginine kinase activator protein McsA